MAVTAAEAERYGLTGPAVESFAALAERYGLAGDVVVVQPGWADQLLDALASPRLAWLLLFAAAVAVVMAEARADRPMNRPDSPDTWKPWFPVIDTDRCTNCMQCLTFCLFDVYGVAADHTLRVENPANCKVNCPACSRVCPEVAIMFPKYHAGPIDGSPVRQQDVAAEKMKVDISALLGGDIYEKLRQRSEGAKARFSKERDAKQALSERRRCLTKLADAAQIPREVLDALPTPEEIERRTSAAAEKAAAALAARESQAPG